MKRVLAWLALVLSLFIIQSSLLPLISWHGVTVDLLLLLTLSIGLKSGARYGVLFGFISGLLEDLATGTFFGLNTFSKMVIGYVCGTLSDRVFHGKALLAVVASLFCTIANFLIITIIMCLLGYRFDLWQHTQYTLYPMLVLNLLFAWPMEYLVYTFKKTLRRLFA